MIVPTAAVLLACLLACGALAQDAEPDSDAPAVATPSAERKPHPPLVIGDETIGVIPKHQVGSIILPDGKPPFPAVIVLHGCNGVARETRIWARRFADWGYAALILDSFSDRGLAQVCDGSRAFPGYERAKDVFAAAAYLRSRADIDGARLAVFGYSHGGWTALNASIEKRATEAGQPPFRAVVALYPFCPVKVAPPLASDVQIFIGDADDWAKPDNCKVFVDKYAADAPHRPSLLVYPGARHSFDSNLPDRMFYGHRLTFDPKATDDAIARIRTFFAEQ